MRTDGGVAWVRVGGQGGCAACDAGRGCGAGVFGRLLRRKPVELAVSNGIEARAGQRVTLGMPESLFIRLVVRLYGWPLGAGLAGAIAGHQAGAWVQAGPAAADLLTLGGMVAGAGAVLRFVRGRGPDLSENGVSLLSEAAGETCHAPGFRSDGPWHWP